MHLSDINASGRTFTIKTSGNSAEALYVRGATFNGKPLDRCWLYRSEVFKGGFLELEMGTEPSDIWDSTVPPVSE